MTRLKILIVDDEPLLGMPLKRSLESAGYQARLAQSGADALQALTEESFDLLLEDLCLPDADGLDIMGEVLNKIPHCRALVMTGNGTIEKAVKAMKMGAFDFLTKPFTMEALFQKLHSVTEFREVEEVIDSLGREDGVTGECITRSPVMKDILQTAAVVAATDATVLLLGESGTGKDLLAEIIHAKSRRGKNPCIKVNCAAIPETLFESELFGVERGAYTGADRSRGGYLEAADKGTLYLDEIAELPLSLQGKFLRALGEKTIYRVGGSREYDVDFRLVAATNKDLKSLAGTHEFREDLFFRINVVPITIPPLRERREDIPLLIAYFQRRFQEKHPCPKPHFSPEALETLCNYGFPGNVRELQNIVEHISILHPGEIIKPRHLSVSLQNPDPVATLFESFAVGKPLKEAVADFENKYIEKVLHSVGGHKSRSASILGLSRKVLWERLKRIREA